jgi:hypothetical protein
LTGTYLNVSGLSRGQHGHHHAAAPRVSGADLHEGHSAGHHRSDSVAELAARMGTIMIRFVGLLFLAVMVLALVWSR